MNVTVQMVGTDRLRAWLLTAEERFTLALWSSTEKGTEIEAEFVRRNTPSLTGRLRGSIDHRVMRMPSGSEGEVFTTTPWARFVERGTRQHGRAQLMFQHGAQEAAPEIKRLFHNSVSEITSSFSSGA